MLFGLQKVWLIVYLFYSQVLHSVQIVLVYQVFLVHRESQPNQAVQELHPFPKGERRQRKWRSSYIRYSREIFQLLLTKSG